MNSLLVWCIFNLMSKKGNCCARFEFADCRGCHCHVLLKGHPCSSVDKAKELGVSCGDEEDNEEEAQTLKDWEEAGVEETGCST